MRWRDRPKEQAVTNWSQPHTVKSNARRAAKKDGVDPAKVEGFVKAGKTLYRFPMPAAKPAAKAKAPAKTAPKAKAKAKTAKAPKAHVPKTATQPAPETSARKGGDKFTTVAAMLRVPGGASMTAITRVTGWKPHSARARISVDVSKLLSPGEVLERRRQDGESHYSIVKQMDLPLEK